MFQKVCFIILSSSTVIFLCFDRLQIKYNCQILACKQKQRCGWLGLFNKLICKPSLILVTVQMTYTNSNIKLNYVNDQLIAVFITQTLFISFLLYLQGISHVLRVQSTPHGSSKKSLESLWKLCQHGLMPQLVIFRLLNLLKVNKEQLGFHTLLT